MANKVYKGGYDEVEAEAESLWHISMHQLKALFLWHISVYQLDTADLISSYLSSILRALFGNAMQTLSWPGCPSQSQDQRSSPPRSVSEDATTERVPSACSDLRMCTYGPSCNSMCTIGCRLL